jgi:RND superfamily putative drug exporter
MRRLALFLHRHRRRVLIAGGVFFAAAGALGGSVVAELSSGPDDFQKHGAENVVEQKQVRHALGGDYRLGLVAVVRVPADPRTSAAGRARISSVASALRAEPGIGRVVSYVDTRDPGMVSRDGTRSYVAANIASHDEGEVIKRLKRHFRGQPVVLGGREAVFDDINRRITRELVLAEIIALPVLFLLALWVFRGLVAALLPPLVAAVAVALSFLVLRGVNVFSGLSVYALNLVTALALGLAIDYSLFVVNRYREEVVRSGPGPEALARTLSTAGRTVLFSCLTVGAALASLMVFPLGFLYSMGLGGLIVALMAGAVSLLLLPALLAVLGTRVNALAPARWQRSVDRAARPAQAGGWYRLAHAVMRRPLVVAVATAAVMLVAGIPALKMHLVPASYRALPAGSPVRAVSESLEREFPTDASAAIEIAATAPAQGGNELRAYARRLRALPDASAVGEPRYLGEQTWQILVPPAGDPVSSGNRELVRHLRSVPSSFPVRVGGPTAGFVDQVDSLHTRLWLALGVLGVMTTSVLFLMTGSVILPVKALLMNLLTLSATFGILVAIFQQGHLEGLLHFKSAGGLDATQPLILFAVAFGLATDYGVFLLSRIKEAWESGMPNRESVAFGVERTGRIVTAAALLYCAAMGGFVTSSVVFIKQVAFGQALAVAIDATIVRALLVPALMAMLGRWNWWAPAPLRRLYERVGLGDARPHEAPA